MANRHLADSILRQHVTYISNHENIKATSNAISHANNTKYEKIQAHLKASLPPCISKMIIFASEKGASSWLTGRPLESSGHVLNKQFFQDAICLRYNFTIPNRAATCICGEPNTVDHTLICKRGPFVNCRHNRLCDVIAELLNKCLPEVSTESPLLPVTGESLPRETTLEPGARLDILARGFYSPMERAFFDVRVSLCFSVFLFLCLTVFDCISQYFPETRFFAKNSLRPISANWRLSLIRAAWR